MSDSISGTDVVSPAEDTVVPSLTLSDIQNAIAVIDYAADQGAYKGWATIEKVLLVRNRMTAFLTAASPPEAAVEPAAEAASGTTTAPVDAPADVPAAAPVDAPTEPGVVEATPEQAAS